MRLSLARIVVVAICALLVPLDAAAQGDRRLLTRRSLHTSSSKAAIPPSIVCR